MPSRRTKVFISYSHKDRNWLTRLRVHLKPLEADFKIETWDDSRIVPGSKWQEEIANAIESSKIAVLLISADFLASDFITTNELPPLLNAAEKDGAIILPVILSPSRFKRTKGLSEFQTINDLSSPLINMTPGEQESVFERVSAFIETTLTSSQDFLAPGPQDSESFLTTAKTKRTTELQEERISVLDKLEATVSNPHYQHDSAVLGDRCELSQVISSKTIIIVTGSEIVPELLDRPVAEIIRDEVDRLGHVSIGRRGIVIGDVYWFKNADIRSHHVISVGGPVNNPLTKEIETGGVTLQYAPGIFRSVTDNQFLRVAVWGQNSIQTRESAELYIRDPEGLVRMLDVCWR